MQSAFFVRSLPPPTASSCIFARFNSSGTWCTTDADKSFIMQSIIGHIEFFYVIQHFIVGPMYQRIELIQLPVLIPFYNGHILPVLRLFGSQSRDPYLGSGQCTVQWFYFADI